jgi:uncharacterized protein
MTQPLLQTPERAAIEALLATAGEGAELLTFEYLHGYLTGLVLTPGGLLPSEWVTPLLEKNEVVFPDLATGKRFFDRVIALFQRLNEARLNQAELCPYEVSSQQLLDEDMREEITEWVCGLHAAIVLRPAAWLVGEDEAPGLDPQIRKELMASMPMIFAVADPEAIPEVIPDPRPFQEHFLSRTEGWTEEMFTETWDDELIDLYTLVCHGQLRQSVAALQDFSAARGATLPPREWSETRPVVRRDARVGRNDPCPCGSGKKFKKCCGG